MTEDADLTRNDMCLLGALCTRNEDGRHFTEAFATDWLARMERLGYLTIDRPIHEATGLVYSPEYWTVAVAPEVEDCFDTAGDLIIPDE